MGFDILYQKFFPIGVSAGIHPATGEVTECTDYAPLGPDELAAVRATLQDLPMKADESLLFDYPGGSAVIQARDLKYICWISLFGGFGPEVAELLFAILRAGNWTMIPIGEPIMAITCTPEENYGVPDSLPLVVCRSTEELQELMSAPFGQWVEWRNRAVPRPDFGDSEFPDPY